MGQKCHPLITLPLVRSLGQKLYRLYMQDHIMNIHKTYHNIWLHCEKGRKLAYTLEGHKMEEDALFLAETWVPVCGHPCVAAFLLKNYLSPTPNWKLLDPPMLTTWKSQFKSLHIILPFYIPSSFLFMINQNSMVGIDAFRKLHVPVWPKLSTPWPLYCQDHMVYHKSWFHAFTQIELQVYQYGAFASDQLKITLWNTSFLYIFLPFYSLSSFLNINQNSMVGINWCIMHVPEWPKLSTPWPLYCQDHMVYHESWFHAFTQIELLPCMMSKLYEAIIFGWCTSMEPLLLTTWKPHFAMQAFFISSFLFYGLSSFLFMRNKNSMVGIDSLWKQCVPIWPKLSTPWPLLSGSQVLP